MKMAQFRKISNVKYMILVILKVHNTK